MAEQDTKEKTLMISILITFNLILGQSINMKISLLILEMATLCLLSKKKFTSLEDGITNPNIKIYLSMIQKLKCGQILK